jgi:Phage terminase-like protein, large subunit
VAPARRARAPRPAPARPAGERVARFYSRYLRHLKGRWAGEPFVLERWQREGIVDPLFGTLDKRGLRRYREALIGLPRKNGKSELASGLALYLLVADGEFGAEVYSLAGSRAQARIVFGNARDMVLASPMLRAMTKVYRDAIEVPETASVYRVLSADSRLAHGYNPHGAIVDELHVHPTADLYQAMATGTGARRQPLIVSITTAGWQRGTIAHELYEKGRRSRDPRFFFRWWEAPAGCRLDDTRAWRKANPARWITVDYLRGQMRAPGMHESVFRRLHLNQWVGSERRWIAQEVWDAGGGRPVLSPGDAVWVGVDAAPKRDTTAVVVDRRDDDGVHHVVARVWEADRQMGYLDFAEVEDYLRQLCVDFDVRRILVDPFTMMRSMVLLREEGLPVEEFPQGDARMVPASQTLYDLALEGRLRHGDDSDLRRQADNAAVRETARGWRLHKLKSTGHIDSIVALAMAAHTAEQDAATGGDDPSVWVF